MFEPPSVRTTRIYAVFVVMEESSGTVSETVPVPAGTDCETCPTQFQFESQRLAVNVLVVVAEYWTLIVAEPVEVILVGHDTDVMVSVAMTGMLSFSTVA